MPEVVELKPVACFGQCIGGGVVKAVCERQNKIRTDKHGDEHGDASSEVCKITPVVTVPHKHQEEGGEG